MKNIRIIHTDGHETLIPDGDWPEIYKELGTDILDHVTLRNRDLMMVDDLGHGKSLPVNHKATRLYWSVCKPGTTHPIVGPVAVIPAKDNPEPEEDAESEGPY
jgi:hypothetical protein